MPKKPHKPRSGRPKVDPALKRVTIFPTVAPETRDRLEMLADAWRLGTTGSVIDTLASVRPVNVTLEQGSYHVSITPEGISFLKVQQ